MFIRSFELRELGTSSYINDLPVVQSLLRGSPIQLRSSVTYVVGENGAGKSTLVEAIAVGMGFNPEGGSKHARFSSRKKVSGLHDWLTISRARNPRDGYFVRAESMNRVFSYLDSPEVYDSRSGPLLHTLSHGQSFMQLLEHRFHNRGLFILDEPESGLAPHTQVRAAARIADLANRGAQFIIATHSPILLAIPGAQILEISEAGINEVAYEDTELVQATREFLDDPLGTAAFLCQE